MSPEQIQEALTVECEMCHAPAGCECTSIIDGKPLREGPQGFPVHWYRRDVA